MKCLIITLFFLITAKWIIFILFAPFICLKSYIIRSGTNHTENLNKKKHYSIKKTWIKNIGFIYFGLIRYYDIQIGHIPSHIIRNLLYRNIFKVNLKKNAVIYYGAEIREHNKLTIGEGSIIGDKAILDARNGIEIGKNVNLSTGVSIWTEQHDHRDPEFKCNSSEKYKVTIEDRAWIGPNAIILHSVKIGEGAVVGAGSVVTKDVEPFTVVGGIPAKIINHRNQDLKYCFDGKYIPFL